MTSLAKSKALSVADLLEAAATLNQSFILRVLPETLPVNSNGLLHVENGQVVFASYKEQTGTLAACQMLRQDAASFEMLPASPTRRRNVLLNSFELLRQVAEGR